VVDVGDVEVHGCGTFAVQEDVGFVDAEDFGGIGATALVEGEEPGLESWWEAVEGFLDGGGSEDIVGACCVGVEMHLEAGLLFDDDRAGVDGFGSEYASSFAGGVCDHVEFAHGGEDRVKVLEEGGRESGRGNTSIITAFAVLAGIAVAEWVSVELARVVAWFAYSVSPYKLLRALSRLFVIESSTFLNTTQRQRGELSTALIEGNCIKH
jgi:hypothetical protein